MEKLKSTQEQKHQIGVENKNIWLKLDYIDFLDLAILKGVGILKLLNVIIVTDQVKHKYQIIRKKVSIFFEKFFVSKCGSRIWMIILL